MRKLIALGLGLVVGLAGCKTNCRQLTEALCECTVTSSDHTNCLSAAANAEQSNYPTATDEATCAALLPVCDCRLIDTAPGKANCGLARPLATEDGGL